MGETEFQKFIFALMMCFSMVLGMTVYNMFLIEGWSEYFLLHLVKDFWLGFFIALFLDIFIIGKLAKTLAFKIIDHFRIENMAGRILIIIFSIVTGMVLCMSLFGSVMAAGFTGEALKLYPRVLVRNFIMALPLNIFIVSPLIRFLHGRIFPSKAAVQT